MENKDVIAPYDGDPKVTSLTQDWYQLTGYDSMSPYLEFDLKDSYYCFEEGTEYHLWFGEDLYPTHSEHDNSDSSVITDIYIKY